MVGMQPRLYQRRFLQPNTHFLALFEIYKIYTPSHHSKFKIFPKYRQSFTDLHIFIFSSTSFDQIRRFFSPVAMKFSQNVKNDEENLSNFRDLMNFDELGSREVAKSFSRKYGFFVSGVTRSCSAVPRVIQLEKRNALLHL